MEFKKGQKYKLKVEAGCLPLGKTEFEGVYFADGDDGFGGWGHYFDVDFMAGRFMVYPWEIEKIEVIENA